MTSGSSGPCFPWTVRLGQWLARQIAGLLIAMLYRFRVHGVEHLPRTGGALLAASHASFLDPIVIGVAARRRVTFTPRTTLSDSVLYRLLTRFMPVVPIGRGSADRAAIKRIVEVLDAGEMVAVFPEQTRSRDGLLGPAKGGVHLLARRATVPLIPVLVHGAYEIWPRHRRMPRLWGRGCIEVRIGPARPGPMEREATLAWLRDAWIALGGQQRAEGA